MRSSVRLAQTDLHCPAEILWCYFHCVWYIDLKCRHKDPCPRIRAMKANLRKGTHRRKGNTRISHNTQASPSELPDYMSL